MQDKETVQTRGRLWGKKEKAAKETLLQGGKDTAKMVT